MRRKEREVTRKEEIISIINSADVCRVSFADNNTPYIVTMNFGFIEADKPVLYFHCAPRGRKLDMLRKNSYVCFEMDVDHELYNGAKGCEWGMKFRSIVGYGNIFIVEDYDERKRGLDCIMDHYGGNGNHDYDEKVLDRTTILRLEILEMTAKSTTKE